MRARKTARLPAAAALSILLLAGSGPVRAQPAADPGAMDADDARRWTELTQAYFPGRTLEPAGSALRLEAPVRAADAALVPVGVDWATDAADPVRRLYLLVDDNPVPLALTATLGGVASVSGLRTRVRVDQYTYIHAVAETASGRLLQTGTFIKASGGCSAPALKDPAEAMARLGRMKLNLPPAAGGDGIAAQLLVSHPNSSGLQFDQVSRTYIPAHYVRHIAVRFNGEVLLDLETDISLSEDPSIEFRFHPGSGGTLAAEADDSKGARFRGEWPVGAGPA